MEKGKPHTPLNELPFDDLAKLIARERSRLRRETGEQVSNVEAFDSLVEKEGLAPLKAALLLAEYAVAKPGGFENGNF